MRLGVVVSDGHATGTDPRWALERDRELVAAVRGRLDGITLHHGWATGPRWNLQALTAAAYLAADAGPLGATVRGLPLGVLNPIELAEQLATLDHAWDGRFSAGFVLRPAPAYASFGMDPALGPARFDEALHIVRQMWAGETFSGDGPQFAFGEVRPTLRPLRQGGPPLSLGVADAAGALLAARRGLGLHVEPAATGARDDVVSAYRLAGGAGTVSVELELAEAGEDELAACAAAGVDQVDVRLRHPGDDPTSVLAAVDELAERAETLRAA